MTDNRNDAASNVGRGLKNRSVLIAIALAILALIAVVLIMRGSGDQQAAGTMEGSTPGYGQPNSPPTTTVPPDEGGYPPAPPAAEGAAQPPAG
jgi:hypothetical protein